MDGDSHHKHYLTMRAFARRVGVSYPTVARWVRQGRIVHYQPGGWKGRVLIPRDALDQSGPGLRGQRTIDGIVPGIPPARSGPTPKWMDDDAW